MVSKIQGEGCDDFYVGEAGRPLGMRFKKHVVVTRASRVHTLLLPFAGLLACVGQLQKSVLRNRGYYMAARRYEMSLRVLKNISLVRCAHS